jgi:hypothetical protein
MGYLYNEIIECRHKKSLKYGLAGMLFLLILDTVTTVILTYKGYAAILSLAGTLVFLSMTIPAYFIWVRTNCRYKYSIIDNELIIERLKGSKRSVLLNINLKAIERIEKTDQRIRNDRELVKWKKCSFMEKKNRGYLCVYKLNNQIHGFCFEPSQKLIDKIYSVIGEKVVA